jgi:lambda family phage holin
MFEKFPPETQAFFLAILIAALRVVYDNEETKIMRVCLESLICGLLSVAIFHLFNALAMSPSFSVFAAGMVGFLGTNSVRGIAVKIINKRLK